LDSIPIAQITKNEARD